MSIPAPSNTYGAQPPHSSTSTTNTASASYPVAIPAAEYEGPRRSLEHPPGYQQNTYASEPTSDQRLAQEANGSSGVMAGSEGGLDADSVWNVAKKWAQTAGEKISEAEAEVWRKINKEWRSLSHRLRNIDWRFTSRIDYWLTGLRVRGDRACGILKRAKTLRWSRVTPALKNRLNLLFRAHEGVRGVTDLQYMAGGFFSFGGFCMNHDGVQSRLRVWVASLSPLEETSWFMMGWYLVRHHVGYGTLVPGRVDV
jgi:hypothetical protein